MGKIITGQSTDLEFLNAINEKGASLTEKATPAELASAIDATGTNVSYDSPNEVVVASVNTEPVSTDVPWDSDLGAKKFLIRKNVTVDFSDGEHQALLQMLLDAQQSYTINVKYGTSVDGAITLNASENTVSLFLCVGSYSTSVDPSFGLQLSYVGELSDDIATFELVDADSCYAYQDEVSVYFDENETIVDFDYLPKLVSYITSSSVGDPAVLISDLIRVFVETDE